MKFSVENAILEISEHKGPSSSPFVLSNGVERLPLARGLAIVGGRPVVSVLERLEDAVAQHADALDLEFDFIAGL